VGPLVLANTPTPTYAWQPIPAAGDYALTVLQDNTVRFQAWLTASEVGCAGGSGTCQVTPAVTLGIGDAAWRLQARHAGGEGPASDLFEFAVAPLEAPTLLAPTGVISATTPTYTWRAVLAAAEYGLAVADSTGTRREAWVPAEQAGCAANGICQLTPEWPLPAGATTWQVQARHAGGPGPRSSPGTFTVDPALGDRQWTTWTKWAEPVFLGFNGAGDPSVLREGGVYRMAYTCSTPEEGRALLCLAESPDGFTWQNIPASGDVTGLILEGRSGEWDEHLETSYLIKAGDTYRLFYSGYPEPGSPIPGFPGFLGLAESADARTFTRVSPGAVLQPTPGGHDNDALFSPTVVVAEGTQYLLYTGHCFTDCAEEPGVRLLAATSADGVTWTKLAEPVLTRSTELAWMSEGVGEADLILGPDGAFYLFFTGLQGSQRVLGVARGASPLGPWEINPVPIVSPTAGGFDEGGVLAPQVLIEENKARMWYLSFTAEGYPWIGYAESVWPLFTSPQ
jgi:predicted GH43/DUF377 family glycosyl hydrolase